MLELSLGTLVRVLIPRSLLSPTPRLKLSCSSFVEHQTASGQDILAAMPDSLRLVVPGACTCCNGSSSCSCCP